MIQFQEEAVKSKQDRKMLGAKTKMESKQKKHLSLQQEKLPDKY